MLSCVRYANYGYGRDYYKHVHAAQPVTYLSLALTLATGMGVTAYYLHLKEKRLKSASRAPCVCTACERS